MENSACVPTFSRGILPYSPLPRPAPQVFIRLPDDDMRKLRSMASDLAGIKAVMDAMGHGGPAGAGMQGNWDASLVVGTYLHRKACMLASCALGLASYTALVSVCIVTRPDWGTVIVGGSLLPIQQGWRASSSRPSCACGATRRSSRPTRCPST